jgi:hypothetical protein
MLASTWWAILALSVGLEYGVDLFLCVQVGGGGVYCDNNVNLQPLGPALPCPWWRMGETFPSEDQDSQLSSLAATEDLCWWVRG